jgi:hypothetical protein
VTIETPARFHLPAFGRRSNTTALACGDCGVTVKHPVFFERLTSISRAVEVKPGYVKEQERDTEIVLTRCSVCAERHERAESLLTAFPRVARSLGSRSHALNLVEAALGALDVLDVKAARIDALVGSEHGLRLLIQHLPTAGALARWSSRLVPITQLGADPAALSSFAWGHVSPEEGQLLRDAYGALLRARTDKPIPVAPPEGGACLLCGVGTLVVLHSRAEEVWGSPRRANVGTLGGKKSAERVTGHLCPPCAAAADSAGAIGPTALESSLLDFVGVPKSGLWKYQLSGYPAWCALPTGTPPNETRWAHVPNLATLATDLEKS